MTAEELQRRKDEIVARRGPWTAHNIHLGHGVFTISSEVTGEEIKARRYLQLLRDLVPVPFERMRIADLGCLEALYGIEFALRGASVVGLEGRSQNVERARFAKDALALDRLELVEDDVRNFTPENYGEFDAILCTGLLYHLEAESAFELLENLRRMSRSLAVVDTHVALTDAELALHADAPFWVPVKDLLSGLYSRTRSGVTFWGRDFTEHDPAATEEQRMAAAWSSLDNMTSFWPTRPSLFNALWAAGFTSVLECQMPALPGAPPDRLTVAAIPGSAKEIPQATDLLARGVHELQYELELKLPVTPQPRGNEDDVVASARQLLGAVRRRIRSRRSK
jgi:SAM-dependent methyltransferase